MRINNFGGNEDAQVRRQSISNAPPSSYTIESGPSSSASSEEFVEVTIDLQDDDTIILRSVEPASAVAVYADHEFPAASAPASRSHSMKRLSSSKFRQFSQELKAEAVAKAKHFSQEFKAEFRKFSWSHRTNSASSAATTTSFPVVQVSGVESALAARALRRQRARLDRTRSGAHNALRGLRFISSNCKAKPNGVDAWSEVQRNFEKLAKDGFLHRSDFSQCIGLVI